MLIKAFCFFLLGFIHTAYGTGTDELKELLPIIENPANTLNESITVCDGDSTSDCSSFFSTLDKTEQKKLKNALQCFSDKNPTNCALITTWLKRDHSEYKHLDQNKYRSRILENIKLIEKHQSELSKCDPNFSQIQTNLCFIKSNLDSMRIKKKKTRITPEGFFNDYDREDDWLIISTTDKDLELATSIESLNKGLKSFLVTRVKSTVVPVTPGYSIPGSKPVISEESDLESPLGIFSLNKKQFRIDVPKLNSTSFEYEGRTIQEKELAFDAAKVIPIESLKANINQCETLANLGPLLVQARKQLGEGWSPSNEEKFTQEAVQSSANAGFMIGAYNLQDAGENFVDGIVEAIPSLWKLISNAETPDPEGQNQCTKPENKKAASAFGNTCTGMRTILIRTLGKEVDTIFGTCYRQHCKNDVSSAGGMAQCIALGQTNPVFQTNMVGCVAYMMRQQYGDAVMTAVKNCTLQNGENAFSKCMAGISVNALAAVATAGTAQGLTAAAATSQGALQLAVNAGRISATSAKWLSRAATATKTVGIFTADMLLNPLPTDPADLLKTRKGLFELLKQKDLPVDVAQATESRIKEIDTILKKDASPVAAQEKTIELGREKAPSPNPESIGKDAIKESDLDLATRTARENNRDYAWGRNLTGDESSKFKRPVTSSEGLALKKVPESIDNRDVHLWLRRVELADPKRYQQTVDAMKDMSPKDLENFLKNLGKDTSKEKDLELATSLVRSHRHNYAWGKNLSEIEAKNYTRPVTKDENQILKLISGSPEDKMATHMWLRRVEMADPKKYQELVERLKGASPDQMPEILGKIPQSRHLGKDAMSDVKIADEVLSSEIKDPLTWRREYARGDHFSEKAKDHFNRKLTTTEEVAMEYASPVTDKLAVLKWLRRVEQADPDTYEKVLYKLKTSLKDDQAGFLEQAIKDKDLGKNPESDVRLAMDILGAEKAPKPTKQSKEVLSREEAIRHFQRPVTEAEQTILKDIKDKFDSNDVKTWLRVTEKESSETYKNVLDTLQGLSPENRQEAVKKILQQVESGINPESNRNLANEIIMLGSDPVPGSVLKTQTKGTTQSKPDQSYARDLELKRRIEDQEDLSSIRQKIKLGQELSKREKIIYDLTDDGKLEISEIVTRNSKLTMPERVKKLDEYLRKQGREITIKQEEALKKAHEVGMESPGSGVYKYSEDEIKLKIKILREAGFKSEDVYYTLKSGLAGGSGSGLLSRLFGRFSKAARGPPELSDYKPLKLALDVEKAPASPAIENPTLRQETQAKRAEVAQKEYELLEIQMLEINSSNPNPNPWQNPNPNPGGETLMRKMNLNAELQASRQQLEDLERLQERRFVIKENTELVHFSMHQNLENALDVRYNHVDPSKPSLGKIQESTSSGSGLYTVPLRSVRRSENGQDVIETINAGGDKAYIIPVPKGASVLDLEDPVVSRVLQRIKKEMQTDPSSLQEIDTVVSEYAKSFKTIDNGKNENFREIYIGQQAIEKLARLSGNPDIIIGRPSYGSVEVSREVIVRNQKFLQGDQIKIRPTRDYRKPKADSSSNSNLKNNGLVDDKEVEEFISYRFKDRSPVSLNSFNAQLDVLSNELQMKRMELENLSFSDPNSRYPSSFDDKFLKRETLNRDILDIEGRLSRLKEIQKIITNSASVKVSTSSETIYHMSNDGNLELGKMNPKIHRNPLKDHTSGATLGSGLYALHKPDAYEGAFRYGIKLKSGTRIAHITDKSYEAIYRIVLEMDKPHIDQLYQRYTELRKRGKGSVAGGMSYESFTKMYAHDVTAELLDADVIQGTSFGGEVVIRSKDVIEGAWKER